MIDGRRRTSLEQTESELEKVALLAGFRKLSVYLAYTSASRSRASAELRIEEKRPVAIVPHLKQTA
jgi:hypothetical protein